MFFTDENIVDFFKAHYPEYYKTYLNLPIKIQRIDFFRYVAVYHYGGFYLDLDMLCLTSFNNLLNYECIFPVDEYISGELCKHQRYKEFCDNKQNFLLGQYAFAASPKHPFIKKLIDNIHNNINKYIKYVDFGSDDYVYKTTGPDFVTEVYMKYNDSDSIFILDNGKRQYFGNYAKHNYFGSWK
jgi:mannosyltransferase OCH1-like enzyme